MCITLTKYCYIFFSDEKNKNVPFAVKSSKIIILTVSLKKMNDKFSFFETSLKKS